MRIILASNSPRRRELLSQIGIAYEVIPSDYEEQEQDMEPETLVRHFAHMKALDVYNKQKSTWNESTDSDALIIGADTIVYKDRIMGKPKNGNDAFQMLKSLGGKSHYVMSGIALIRLSDGKCVTDVEKTLVRFREIEDEEITRYVNTGEPADKAGAYAIQGFGSIFVEGIEGCYFNVVGLPVFKLGKMLQSFGVRVL